MTAQAGVMAPSSQEAALSYSGGHCHCMSQFRIFKCQLSEPRLRGCAWHPAARKRVKVPGQPEL